MKTIKIILCSALLSIFGFQFSVPHAQRTMLSPSAAMKVLEIREGKCQSEYLHAFVTLAEGVDLKALVNHSVRINSVVGDMMTVQIPVKQYSDLVASGICSYIDLGNEVQTYLDRVRTELGIDYIYQGINLPQGYDGTGVVVGIIDIGFEYDHPSFYDSTGSVLRIKRVWQQRDNTGNPPAGFTYGSEFTTPEEILAAVTDDPQNGHGCHVAGMAAGCGAPDSNGKKYRGMAPAADIVLVGTTMEEPDIFDGIRYLHEYARSVHKPLVINMSLGSNTGPHDGMGIPDVMTSYYLNGLDSVVVVVAAANSGTSKGHLHHQFSATDTVMHTYCNTSASGSYYFAVDCWGAMGDQFSLSVALHDKLGSNTYAFVSETPFFPSSVDSIYSFQFTSPRDTVYNCTVVTRSSNQLNQKPEIMVSITKQGSPVSADVFSLTLKSDSADVHLWSDRQNFSSNGDAQFEDGDADYTIGGFAANSDAVISVGSYATRTSILMANGSVQSFTMTEEGDLSEFSSHGPTADNRVKPDICTPGQIVASAINTPYIPLYSPQRVVDSTVFNGQTYYYCLMQGTSMASPAMTGIVALWLQQNPTLNVDTVRTILHTTARHDSFTGDIPATGSNLWGWGKVDAFAGLPATTVPLHYLKATVDYELYGTVTGRGRHPEGPVVIHATAYDGFTFREWSDGNTDNPRIVNLVSDTAFTALFDTATCDTVTSFPWNIEFTEGILNCWDNFSTIEGDVTWVPVMGNMVSRTLTGNVDNWLVSPYLVPETRSMLYYACVGLSGDSLAIVIITESGDSVTVSDELIIPTGISTDNAEEHHTDLSAYAGQPVRFAFRHHYSAGTGVLMLSSARVETLQGIEEVEGNEIRVKCDGHNMIVDNPNGETIGLYDVMGRQLATSHLSSFVYRLPTAGIYILRMGEKSQKIVIR